MPRCPGKVFVAEDGTEAAQQEVLELIVGHLQRYFPAIDRRRPSSAEDLRAAAPPCLAARPGRSRADAARRGWLAACRRLAVLSLVLVARRKVRPSAAGHPHAGAGLRARHAHRRHHPPHLRQSRRANSRSSGSTGRCRPAPTSISRCPTSARIDRAEARPSRFPEADVAENAFIRVERQTLRKLPGSGDILFTIRISSRPDAGAGKACRPRCARRIVCRAARGARHGPARLQGARRRPRPAGRAAHRDGCIMNPTRP